MKALAVGLALSLGCAQAAMCAQRDGAAASAQFDAVIAKHAQANGVPEALIRRVIMRESRYNPRARHRSFYGMMQISPATARSMGYRGSPEGLLDADVNLAYGVRYLAGAYRTAGGSHDRAVRYYASGYYYDAKRRGLLAAIGMGRDGKTTSPAPSAPDTSVAAAAPAPAVRTIVPAAPVLASAVPVPPSRGAAPVPAVVASAVPVPQPSEVPATTGSIPSRAAGQPPRPAAPVVPTPPQAAPPAVVTVAATSRPSALQTAAVPLPAPRDIVPATPAAPPSIAAIAPVPTPRDFAPAAGPLRTAAAPRTRVISPDAAPVLASAGPIAPAKPAAPRRSTAATPVLAYTDAPASDPNGASGQLRAVAPLPPRR